MLYLHHCGLLSGESYLWGKNQKKSLLVPASQTQICASFNVMSLWIDYLCAWTGWSDKISNCFTLASREKYLLCQIGMRGTWGKQSAVRVKHSATDLHTCSETQLRLRDWVNHKAVRRGERNERVGSGNQKNEVHKREEMEVWGRRGEGQSSTLLCPRQSPGAFQAFSYLC